jgi:rod shape-determining protein MreD
MAARTTTFWAFIVILVLLHLSLRLAFGLAVIPDLLVVATLLGARRLNAAGAGLFGLVLGVLADSLAVVAFGATAVAFVIVSFLGSRTRNVFEGESYLFVAVYTFLGSWLIEAVRFLAGNAMARGVEPSRLLTEAPLQSLYIAIAAVVSLIAYRAVTGHR